jgi:hypothetical protein
MARRVQLRHGSAADWEDANPILLDGEMGIVDDDFTYKIGNGVDHWLDLDFVTLSGSFTTATFTNQSSDPSSASSGTLIVYSKGVASRSMLKMIGPSGLDVALQPAFFNNSIILIAPSSGSAYTILGTPTPTVTGTTSHPQITSGAGFAAGVRRAIVTSAATAGSIAQLRSTQYQCWRGDTAGQGGFFFNLRFGIQTTTSDAHFQTGLFNATSLTAATTPSAQINWIGVGYDATDTNMQFMYNGSSGTATKVDLGSQFQRSGNGIYDLTLFSAPNGSEIGYRVTRIDTGDTVEGTISTGIPAASLSLAWHAKLHNNTTASAVVFSFVRMYIESDN